MICDDCKYRNQDESAWPCKNCTPDDRRFKAGTDAEILRRIELARLREQLAGARLALVQYGAHDGTCSVCDLDDEGRHCACDCGHEAAIKAAEDKTHNDQHEGPEASAACRRSLSMRQLGAED